MFSHDSRRNEILIAFIRNTTAIFKAANYRREGKSENVYLVSREREN